MLLSVEYSVSSLPVHIHVADPLMCQDHENRVYNEGERFRTLRNFATGNATTSAADVIFVVDESGSIVTHDWIRNVVPLLERRLGDHGVGLGDRRNQYALVGFGRNMPNSIGGIILSQLTSPEDFINATRSLRLDGLIEDGYSAIEFALNEVTVRRDTVRVMVLVTNSDRTVLPGKQDLTRDIIERMTRDNRFVLNAVVDQTFQSSGSVAFGLDHNRLAYVFNSTSPNQYSTMPNGTRNPSLGFRNTYEDYVQLALNLGGAAWDIKGVRAENSPIQAAISSAFVEVKVMEVMDVIRQCIDCLCIEPLSCVPNPSVTPSNCQGPADPMGE